MPLINTEYQPKIERCTTLLSNSVTCLASFFRRIICATKSAPYFVTQAAIDLGCRLDFSLSLLQIGLNALEVRLVGHIGSDWKGKAFCYLA